MHDLSTLTAAVSRRYLSPPTGRAPQCFALLPDGRTFVPQGNGDGPDEDADVSLYSAPDAAGVCRRVGWMRLLDTSHPTMIAGLSRGGRLGVVISWAGVLGWVPWQDTKGRGLTQEQAGFEPIFKGKRYAYIDHVKQTICFRYGSTTYRLFHFDTATGMVGAQIGRELVAEPPARGAIGQGYFAGLVDGEWLLYTMWGVNSTRQWAKAQSFTGTGQQVIDGRVVDGDYVEPQSGYVTYDAQGNGQVHFGYYYRQAATGAKLPITVRVRPRPLSALERLIRKHGRIIRFKIASFEKARRGRYPSRYTAVVQDWLGRPITTTWSAADQAALDAWRHKEWPLWPPSDYQGPVGPTSMGRLAQIAKAKGKKTYKVVVK